MYMYIDVDKYMYIKIQIYINVDIMDIYNDITYYICT